MEFPLWNSPGGSKMDKVTKMYKIAQIFTKVKPKEGIKFDQGGKSGKLLSRTVTATYRS